MKLKKLVKKIAKPVATYVGYVVGGPTGGEIAGAGIGYLVGRKTRRIAQTAIQASDLRQEIARMRMQEEEEEKGRRLSERKAQIDRLREKTGVNSSYISARSQRVVGGRTRRETLG